MQRGGWPDAHKLAGSLPQRTFARWKTGASVQYKSFVRKYHLCLPRHIAELAEDSIPQLLIKSQRLKTERIQLCTATSYRLDFLRFPELL